jgi:putative hydroxymethylpyrimidine transport system substrate-binding protein
LRTWLVFVLGCLVVSAPLCADPASLSVILDFYANPNHAPLYAAIEEGFFRDRGLEIRVNPPGDPSTPITLAASRTFDVALTPQINYLIARSEGLPLLAIGALIDRNLGGLLALAGSGISSVEDLAGRRIGYSLAPLEPILWKTILDCAGVSLEDAELVNVHFATVTSLLSGSIDAVGAFRNYETIQVELQGAQSVFFPQEDFCIPQTYDIILVANPSLVEERSGDLRAFLDGLAEGIAFTRSHPATAFHRFVTALPDLDDELNRRAFDATLPLFAEGARHDDPEVWRGMESYLYENGLVSGLLPLEELYTTALLPGG